MQVRVTTAGSLLVTVQEAADYLNLDSNYPELDNLIRSVQEKAEAYVQKSFTSRTVELVLDQSKDVIELPRYPVTAITSVKTLDESGTETTIATSTYYLPDQRRLVFTTWPELTRDYGGLVITYTAGSASETPDAMKVGILKALSTVFEHREDFIVGASVAKLPDSSMSYFDTWRSLC